MNYSQDTRMYAKKQIPRTHATQPVRQKKPVRNQASIFSDNRPEAFLLKKMQRSMEENSPVLQKSENKTGLPDKLKSGMENLSGYSLNDVKVHYNSDKPAQLQAHAYAQGSDIHLAPGQEKHLPHEAWHVVQQKQGRVSATRQMKGGVHVNDDAGLEQEADVMGRKALELNAETSDQKPLADGNSSAGVVQQMPDWMLKLISMAMQNKYVVGGTALGAAGVLLYYYCKKKPGIVPPQVEEDLPEPTYETLEDLARAIRVKTEVLRTQLEDGIGNLYIHQFYKQRINTETLFTLLVPSFLIADLPEATEQKFNELLERFHQFPFTYTGRSESAGTGFLTRTGDCSTLAQMFQYAAKAAGIEGVTIQGLDRLMMVPSAPIHGRNTQGNVNGQLCWIFDNHSWCQYNGNSYDLLFMINGVPAVSHPSSEKTYKGITYVVFENGKALIRKEMYGNLKAKLSVGREGYVAKSEYAVKRFIDNNKLK